MRDKTYRVSKDATTSDSNTQFVTIMNSNHPLNGQKFRVLGEQNGDSPNFLIQLPDGDRIRIPQNWTDYVQPSANASSVENSHLLDLKGLCKIVKMIDRMKKEGRSPNE